MSTKLPLADSEGEDASADADRAVVNGAGQAVSALRASVPSAWRKFLAWSYPFASVMVGSGLLLAAAGSDGLARVGLVIGGFVFILGALDVKVARAVSAENDRWAKLIAGMIADEGETIFRVEHKFESIRPELDEVVRAEVAQAIEARRAVPNGSVHESAVPQGCAQDTSPKP